MCLSKVDERLKSNRKSGHGWKIFLVKDKEIYFPYYTQSGKHAVFGARQSPLKIGKWMKAKKGLVKRDGPEYEAGYHFYASRSAARRILHRIYSYSYQVRKVLYKNPTTFGRQSGEKVIVARYIMITKNRG